MEIIEGKMPFMGYETYYRIVGKRSEKPPLVLLHGGPGSSHNYFEVLDKLAQIDDRRYYHVRSIRLWQQQHPRRLS